MNSYKRQKLCNDSDDKYLQFDGDIVYYDNVIDADHFLARLLDKLNQSDPLNNKIVIGFDCEWKVFPSRKLWSESGLRFLGSDGQMKRSSKKL